MFKEERKECLIKWKDLGDIGKGRPNLGDTLNLKIYRLMQFTLRDALIKELGTARSGEIFFMAGKMAGIEFCKNVLDCTLDFNKFIADLQKKLEYFGIGILRVEESDLDKMEFIITVAEDLECSGLPVSEETICIYDEGFISGILETYTNRKFNVKEIDCWASGGMICRFHAIIDRQRK